jgi:aspartate carbamoyltransferase catalytic subunit
MEAFPHRSLLDIEGLTRPDVERILDTAEAFLQVSRRPVRKVPTLRGKTVINLFYEASTRTRTSFELAGKRLSADVINMSVSASSVGKGETLQDTCRTLEAMHPDVIVIRHNASGAPSYVASKIGCSVINAGDGMHAHPTQALLDAFTIRHEKGTLDDLVVTIVGDIAHSRVARSNAHLLNLFGCVRVFDRLKEALDGADVVMVLRIQQERLGRALLPSLREYARTFGIGPVALAYAKPDAIVMHPGPMNRGIEIEPIIADGERSVVLQQVEAGVAVRMALLYLCAGETSEAPAVGEVD